jgi:nucleoid-associated protein YgaU
MTRETRIGLLVGLLFIFAFGLLLSELTGREAPGPIPATAVDDLHTDWGLPRSRIEDANPRARPSLPARAVASRGRSAPSGAREARGAVRSAVRNPPPVRHAPGHVVSRLRRAEPAPAEATAGGPPTAGARIYVVKRGDSLIRIARALYGRQHEDQYRRIFQANRNVLYDEAILPVGVRLVIPSLPGRRGGSEARSAETAVASATTPAPRYREMDLKELEREFAPRPARAGERRRVYVTRRGDTLRTIAGRLLGDDSRAAVMRIYNANRTRISDPDELPAGVRLTIPM